MTSFKDVSRKPKGILAIINTGFLNFQIKRTMLILLGPSIFWKKVKGYNFLDQSKINMFGLTFIV